jgi:dipeptidyl aminopeptidase/acylaminoacyl peptidase
MGCTAAVAVLCAVLKQCFDPRSESRCMILRRKRVSLSCSYYRRIAITATAMLMAGCASSSESSPDSRPTEPASRSTEPASTVVAGTTAPSRPRSPAVEGSFGQVGGWIAYAGHDGIWAVDPAHPNRRVRLSRAGRDPIAWSSDGTKLLIRRTSPDRGVDLYILEADATETRLTWPSKLSGARTDADPSGGSFSPDGSEVVYASGPWERSAIYAVSSDGGAPRLILRSTRQVSFPDGRSALAFAYQPALSPDGTRIAYFDGMYDHSHNLWVANADGTKRRVLLDDELSDADHIRALTWAPGGEWLAFTTDASLYLVRPDGTGLRRVVSGGFVTAPAVQWSPDGSRIAYLRMGDTCVSRTGKDEDFVCEAALSIVNVDGGDEQVIEGIGMRENARIAWNPRA